MIKYIKGIFRSRTIWFGSFVTFLSAAASIAPMVYIQLTPMQIETFRAMFGPETMALVGLAVIVLRIVTTKPVSER